MTRSGIVRKRNLNNMGFVVYSFSDGLSASRALNQHLPDVFLIDIMLPEGDLGGPEFVDLVKKQFSLQAPVIFISSKGDWEARLAAYRAGGQAFLSKPVDYTRLLNQLDRLVKRDRPEPYRILIVDDSVELAQFYALVLKNAGMRVEVLNQPEKILQILVSFKPELIILDLHMPEVTGIEVASVIRQHQDLTSITIVFLSTEKNAEVPAGSPGER